MALLRRALGDTLRGQRQRQERTLREVSSAARVSLGYLSEVERGQKEASSELLSAICDALEVQLSEVLQEATESLRASELAVDAAPAGAFGKVVIPPPSDSGDSKRMVSASPAA